MLAKKARGQRDIALDVIEKAGVDLRKHEGDAKRARLGGTSAARAVVAKTGERHMHALGGFGPHGLIVAQHTIDRRHTDAGPPRNHHPCRRHGSPPPAAMLLYNQGSFSREKCKLFSRDKTVI